MKAAIEDAGNQLKSLEERAAGETRTLKDASAEFDKNAVDMRDRISKLEANLAKTNKERDAAVASGLEAVDKANKDADEKVRTFIVDLDQSKSVIDSQSKEINELKRRLAGLGTGKNTGQTVGEADGVVI